METVTKTNGHHVQNGAAKPNGAHHVAPAANGNGKPTPATKPTATIREVRFALMENLNKEDERPLIELAHGDPSKFECFRTDSAAEDAIVDAVRSGKYNSYAPSAGILPARRAIAEYLSNGLPYSLTPDDVFLTLGCAHAIEVTLTALTRPGISNILLPRPGYPYYEACSGHRNLETRHYDLRPENGWEVDLESVESLADENTVAIVIVNPGNPCGNVYSSAHLKEIAETAKKLRIPVIADEVYGHLTFGENPFVAMGMFGSVAPVITLGSISKRWIVPGWRLGWLVISDPNNVMRNSGLVNKIQASLFISPDPPTFIQAAVPQILENTKESFFTKINGLLREAVDLCYDRLRDIPCITCPKKPEGSMFAMVKLECTEMEGIKDDMDFCLKLAKEESVIVLPGTTVGQRNWLRITFAIEPATLEVGLGRIKDFCERHAKKKQ
ncbi:S-alkyl-thiohydroximate lyase SUR1 [Linum grandiflorum]